MKFKVPSLPAYWFWPVIATAVLSLIAATVGFVVFTLQQDQKDQRATLISDVLWLEQNLRFNFERKNELLQRLAVRQEAPVSANSSYSAQIKQALGAETGLERLLWFDAELQLHDQSPPLTATAGQQGFDWASSEAVRDSLARARAFGKPAYGLPSVFEPGNPWVAIAAPGFDGTQLAGYVVGIYPLAKLLASEVPWWFSQRYRLSVLDNRGREIIAKSRVEVLQPELSYEVPFDPPGGGLSLHLDAYRTSTRAVPLIYVSGMIGLTIALLWALWMLWQHTQRRQTAELALRRESSFRKVMEDSLHTGLRARDLDGRVTYVNPAFCRMTGWEAHELIGCGPPMPYWIPEDIERNRQIHDKVMQGEASHQAIELRFLRRNGEHFDALIYEAPLIDEHGRHTGWMGSVVDITERKRAEELARAQQDRLQATARLVTMGELASTLAHELNQPLAAVSAYVSGCITGLEQESLPREELLQVLHKVGRQSQRAGNIIHRIQDFVRRREPRDGDADLVRVVREAAALIDGMARKEHVRIALSFPHDVPTIPGDGALLEQVVVNIMRNGIDAMNETPISQRQLRIAISNRDHAIEVSVCDNGCGISPEVSEKLYTPLFTTKPEGMGMGLNICRSIVESHRGRLHFEPNPSGGTIFRIVFPRS